MNEVITITFTVKQFGWVVFFIQLVIVSIWAIKTLKAHKREDKVYKSKILKLNKNMECLR